MTQFVVREVEWRIDDGGNPERWLGQELARFDTEDEALYFVNAHCLECEVVKE